MSMCVVGSINADLTVNVERHPTPGETLLGAGGGITAGGKGANQAVAAAKLGTPVALVGATGTDANADPATAILREAGVDLRHVEEVEEVTGLAVITVAANGENTVLVVPGANALVDAAFVDRHSDAVETAELVLLQGEIPADGAGTPEELARRLLDAGFASVVLTLGSAGALVATAEELTHIDSPKVEAVDTVGACDSFAGAFCHRILEGDSMADAAAFACRVGAFSVTRPGAQPSYPSVGDDLPEI